MGWRAAWKAIETVHTAVWAWAVASGAAVLIAGLWQQWPLAVVIIGGSLFVISVCLLLMGFQKVRTAPAAATLVAVDDLIHLAEGAKLVYELARAKARLLATAAERMSGSKNGRITDGTPEDVLDYMATYIGGKARIFGSRPPSEKRELTPASEVRAGHFESGGLILKNDRHIFTGLAVSKKDIQTMLAHLEQSEI